MNSSTKLRMFLVCYATASLSFPSQDASSNATQFVAETDQHYWELSLIQSAKRCSHGHV